MHGKPDKEQLRESQGAAIGMIAAIDRRDAVGVKTLLVEWDENATMAMASLTLMLLKKWKGDGTQEWINQTALSVARGRQ